MVGSGPHQAESIRSQHQDHFRDLERKRDWEGSVHTTHTSKSQSQGKSHVSREENARARLKEIDHLKRSLRYEWRKRAPSNSNFFSNGEKDGSYRCRSRTSPSESFLYDEEYHHKCRNKNSSLVGLGNDAMSKAFNRISRSPFTHWIEGGRLPQRFTQPIFTMYSGRIDPMEHVSHFNQKMAVHSKNEALMCKVFPSSLGPVAMRWFDGLKAGSIDSFKEAFGSCFITCSRVPRPLASLLSLSMRKGETLKTYSDRYWEMFNEIDGDFDDVSISTSKLSLPAEHGLRKSLTGKLVTGIC